MLNLSSRQQAMLKEMGVALPWAQSPEIQTEMQSEPQAIQTVPKTTRTVPTDRAHPIQPGPPPQQVSTQEPMQPSAQALSERAQSIARMTWPELQEAVTQCQACPLHKSCTQTVFSAGLPQAQWMIVGEAPGEQEDKQGEPFVGQAGKLLDRMLLPLNLSRHPEKNQKAIYIANVLKCRPPRNRNPEQAEMVHCEPFLKRQIELVQPQVIVLMGRFAVHALLNTTEAIGRLRGQVHQYQNIPVIVTYHPAYLLRNPIDKRKAWADLCLAAHTFKTVETPSS